MVGGDEGDGAAGAAGVVGELFGEPGAVSTSKEHLRATWFIRAGFAPLLKIVPSFLLYIT